LHLLEAKRQAQQAGGQRTLDNMAMGLGAKIAGLIGRVADAGLAAVTDMQPPNLGPTPPPIWAPMHQPTDTTAARARRTQGQAVSGLPAKIARLLGLKEGAQEDDGKLNPARSATGESK
jgi:hypothetical protein